MTLRRQNNSQVDHASIDPVSGFGRGTAVREDDDSLDNGGSSMDVIAVSRGRRIDTGELFREDTDLVGTGTRVDVMARSGNDAGEHEDDDELDDNEFDQVGMGDVAADIAPMGTGVKVVFGLGVAWMLWQLVRR
jgi:hypothetical protein